VRKGEIIFLAKFFLIFFSLYAVILFSDISALTFYITGLECSLLGLGNSGNMALINGGMFEITNSCTGLVSAATLAGIVFALRKPGLKTKAMVFIPGFALLMAVNLARLYVVLWSAVVFGTGFAEIVHVVSWLAMGGAVLAAWYFATKRISKLDSWRGFI